MNITDKLWIALHALNCIVADAGTTVEIMGEKRLCDAETCRSLAQQFLDMIAAAPDVPVSLTAQGWKRVDWQKRCEEIGFVYTRATDDQWCDCTLEQAQQLLGEVLGIEVRIEPGDLVT